MNLYKKFVRYILSLNRSIKTCLIISTDYLLLSLSFWLSVSVKDNQLYFPDQSILLLIVASSLLAIPIFYLFGLYRSLIRYANYQSVIAIIFAVTTYMATWYSLIYLLDLQVKPYDFLIINWLISIGLIGASRFLARWFLIINFTNYSNVLIYGAGSAGRQLESAMKYNPEINVIGFLDDDSRYHGKYIQGLKVFNPAKIRNLISKENINQILIAIPSLAKNDLRRIIDSLKYLPLVIRALPSLGEMVQGRVEVSDLKKIKIEDLLRRPIRKPDEDLLKKDIESKNILVTGAGGSIGSELCMQIIQLNPKLVVLYEVTEFALYQIEQKLNELLTDTKIIPILGNVNEENDLKKAINSNDINTIYHAAAYKHVPMVEKNITAGIRTNIFGTKACVELAIEHKVESFVFISTDKAVNPTSIMGASKRFAEILLQAYSEKSSKTRISIVRFGNVLGSSGSVVPLFESQIKKGGPVTVTDPNIIRYFMTIKEAAQLVIQAGAMGSKGDIFLLDMGDQVKIIDLAKDMIRLSGKTIKDENNKNGDIEIIFTGLRPGEKLYEELLIDENAESTDHKKIMKAIERRIDWETMKTYLIDMKKMVDNDEQDQIVSLLSKTVTGFKLKA